MTALTGQAFVDAVVGRRHVSSRDCRVKAADGLRFAFYGRMSTSEFQDRETSQAWQRAVSDELIEGFGDVVVEYFDEGHSRRWSWSDRPAAAALLSAAETPDRGFDAVVVGEYERAFHGDQFRQVVERLAAVGVQLWLPEAGGPVEVPHRGVGAYSLVVGDVLGYGFWSACGDLRRGPGMSDIEVKREDTLTREEAAERLAALAAGLADGGKVEFALGASTVKVHVRDEVRCEIEIDGDEVEFEVELKWTTGKVTSTATPVRRRARGPKP